MTTEDEQFIEDLRTLAAEIDSRGPRIVQVRIPAIVHRAPFPEHIREIAQRVGITLPGDPKPVGTTGDILEANWKTSPVNPHDVRTVSVSGIDVTAYVPKDASEDEIRTEIANAINAALYPKLGLPVRVSFLNDEVVYVDGVLQ